MVAASDVTRQPNFIPALQICHAKSRCSSVTSVNSTCGHHRTAEKHLRKPSALMITAANAIRRSPWCAGRCAATSAGDSAEEQGLVGSAADRSEGGYTTQSAADAAQPGAEEVLFEKVAAFGEALAAQQEAAFLAAQDEVRRKQDADWEAQEAQQQQQRQQAVAAVQRGDAAIAGAGTAGPAAAAFVAGAGLAASAPPVSQPPAQQTAAASGGGGAAPAATDGATAAATSKPADLGGLNMAAAVQERLAAAAKYREMEKRLAEAKRAEEGDDGEEDDAPSLRLVRGGGSSDVAAGFLGNVMQNNTNSTATPPRKEMSMEKFTRLQEDERRRNVEIITVEQDYQPGERGGYADGYKPKVVTWGMFPRPDNISKAYGGGRTLKPGEALESKDARAARSRRVREAMQRYKQASGLDIDPATVQQAQARLEEGMTAFRAGQLTAALVHFTEAAALMPLRSAIGGEARLQQAICLDSLGKSQAAKAMYTSLKGHPSGMIAKRVKQLLGGFEAMTFLKADTISYAVKPNEYEKYFRRVESTYNTVYYSAVGKEEDLRAPTAIAMAVMGAPLLLLGAKILSKAL